MVDEQLQVCSAAVAPHLLRAQAHGNVTSTGLSSKHIHLGMFAGMLGTDAILDEHAFPADKSSTYIRTYDSGEPYQARRMMFLSGSTSPDILS